jgi:prolyl 4-hydroxylase
MTRETQFIQIPSEPELKRITAFGRDRVLEESQPRILQQYRDPTMKQMNMTLKVLSVAPRVFEVTNFLSQVEVDHILKIAGGIDLQLSKTGDGGEPVKDTTKTRTSYNSWLKRETSPIVDTVYRRAADLLRIDEAFLRYRVDEHNQFATKKSLAEELQLVHYVDRQQYEAHHDFGYSHIDNPQQQGARFATLLLYLNEGMKGGETSFPRWVNGETFKELRVTPVVGKAILFYSQLPDGNLDDFSQHAARPVYDGEKVSLLIKELQCSRVDHDLMLFHCFRFSSFLF